MNKALFPFYLFIRYLYKKCHNISLSTTVLVAMVDAGLGTFWLEMVTKVALSLALLLRMRTICKTAA